jgi:hypothetical protein
MFMRISSHIVCCMLSAIIALSVTSCFQGREPKKINQDRDDSDASPDLQKGELSRDASSDELRRDDDTDPTSKDSLDGASEKGKLYVGDWTGLDDEIPADVTWRLKGVVTATTAAVGNQNIGTVNPGTQTAGGAERTAQGLIFRIRAGTGQGAWNTPQTAIVGRVGETLTIINDDTVEHQLHTNGAPCPHMNSPIPPGGQGICQFSQPYNEGPLYDHLYQQTSQVYISVSAQ